MGRKMANSAKVDRMSQIWQKMANSTSCQICHLLPLKNLRNMIKLPKNLSKNSKFLEVNVDQSTLTPRFEVDLQ